MNRKLVWYAALSAAAVLALPAGGQAQPAQVRTKPFAAVVAATLALPYQPAYAPVGLDTAFPTDADNPAGVPNTAPAQDYTSGSIPGSPDHPTWPTAYFSYKTKAEGLQGFDGAPLRGYLGVHPGTHPGVVVVHGFNTNGKESVIRWATMLYARGYDVLASDQRDFKDEANFGEG